MPEYEPAMLARQIVLSPQENSRASPSGGSSDTEASLTYGIGKIRKLGQGLWGLLSALGL